MLNCDDITETGCTYQVSGKDKDIIIQFLIHYNEVHDPMFVAKCQDDLIAEYQEYVTKIQQRF